MRRFSFTGRLSFNAIDSDNPYFREGKTRADAEYLSVNFAVVASTGNNRGYVEHFGMVRDTISIFDTDGNRVSIPWDKRDSRDSLKKASNGSKYVVKIGENRKEFVSDYDFSKYIVDHVDELSNPDKVFMVNGTIAKNVYNGTIKDRFNVNGIYEVDPPSNDRFRIYEDFYFNKDSFNFDDWKDDKIINIKGYTKENIDKNHKGVFVEQNIVFDCKKLNLEDENDLAKIRLRLKALGCDYKDGKFKYIFKKSDFYSMKIELSFVNGIEIVKEVENEDLNYENLTDYQKEAIQCGDATIETYKSSKDSYGFKVSMLKYIKPDFRNGYENGAVNSDLTEDEFSELIYHAVKIENPETTEINENENENKDEDGDDLFA